MPRIVDLSPATLLPAMDGASKRAWHLYEGMIAQGATGTFIGNNFSATDNEVVHRRGAEVTWRDNKSAVALAAFFTGADYWQLKWINPEMRKKIHEATQKPCDLVIVNFLYSVALLEIIPKPYRLVVDTHNYDPTCFRAIGSKSANPVLKALCYRAAKLSERVLQSLPPQTLLVHVSARDAELYRPHRPDLKHLVVENGTVVRPRSTVPDYLSSHKIIIFVGSLSVKMNQDALHYFAGRFWPAIKDKVEFRVIGSSPSPGVEKLCVAENWKLFANVSDDQLQKHYREAHFSISPFPYGEGSKLKVVEACGHGVPVLSTPCGVVGFERLPALVTISDDPEAWLNRLANCEDINDAAPNGLTEFAQNFSWASLANKLLTSVEPLSMVR